MPSQAVNRITLAELRTAQRSDGTARSKEYTRQAVEWCEHFKLPPPDLEFYFHPTRQWRFDLAWPCYHVALEIDGGVHSRGRHVRGDGYEGDVEKFAEAGMHGWFVLRSLPKHVESGQALLWIGGCIRGIEWAVAHTHDIRRVQKVRKGR